MSAAFKAVTDLHVCRYGKPAGQLAAQQACKPSGKLASAIGNSGHLDPFWPGLWLCDLDGCRNLRSSTARTSLDDALWALLMLAMQQSLHTWERDETGLHRFGEAAPWICRTGTP